MELIDLARELDRRLNAATDPAAMKLLIAERKRVRTEMEFRAALEQFERENPIRPDLPDSFPHVIR